MNTQPPPYLHTGLPKSMLIGKATQISDIVYLESSRNYTFIYFSDGSRQLASKTLGVFEMPLTAFGFVRISKSIIANLAYIKENCGGEVCSVLLSNGSWYQCSRRKSSKVRQAIQNQSIITIK